MGYNDYYSSWRAREGTLQQALRHSKRIDGGRYLRACARIRMINYNDTLQTHTEVH